MEHTIRLYGNPLKQLFLFLVSLVFVVMGLLILRYHMGPITALTAVIAFICIGFFGLGCLVFLYSLARDLLLRHPLLRVDTQGWTYEPSLGFRSQHVAWQNIARIALFRQRVRSSRTMYLVLEARHPEQMPPSRARAMTAHLYPVLSTAVMTVPLNMVFVRASPAKVERLLHRIQAEFAGELHGYGITVDGTIQEM